MEIKKALSVPAEEADGAHKTTIRWLWGKTDGAQKFALRLIEVAPGGSTPHHSHPYEHEVYVLEGKVRLCGDAGEHLLDAGDTAFVQPSEVHQFVNAGDGVLRFLCGIPL